MSIDFVFNLFVAFSDSNCGWLEHAHWIGLHNSDDACGIECRHHWTWTDGSSTANYSHWLNTIDNPQPEFGERCGLMDRNGFWHGGNCTAERLKVVCQGGKKSLV